VATIAASWLPSANVQSMLSVQIGGVDNYLDIHAAFGIAASTPGTYGALSSPGSFTPYSSAQLLVQRAPGSASVVVLDVRGSIGSLGDKAWVLLFMGSPSGSDVPLAVAGPFIVGP
jgi:hypothetical protein